MAPPEWKQYSPDPHRRADRDAGGDAEDPARWPAITPYEAPAELPHVRSIEERTVRRRPGAVGNRVLALVLMGVVVVTGVVIGRADRDPGPGAVVPRLAAEPQGPGPMTAAGYRRLLDALQERQGSTLVFEAVLRDGDAELTVPFATPVAPGDERALELSWNGTELTERDDTSERTAPHDLADLAGTDLAGLCGEARSLLEGAMGCYLIIAEPDGTTQRTLITAWASAPFDAGAVVWFDRHGRKVDQNVTQDVIP